MFPQSVLLAFILTLGVSMTCTVAFLPLATDRLAMTATTTLATPKSCSDDSLLEGTGEVGTPHSSEISRRAALVAAAALAAGATPAVAATLERTVAKLEKKNLANTVGAPEKHIPQVSQDGGTVQVVVPHVMDPVKPHFIEYVWLKDIKSAKVVSVQAYKADDPSPPTLTATLEPGTSVKAMLYCNLHGLWEGESFVVA